MSFILISRAFLYFCVLFLFWLPTAHAADYDVRLVIDVSGSMKKNDPTNLRQPALELLVKLLPENSVAGIWTFGQDVEKIVDHRKVDQRWRDNALKSAKEIGSSAQFTNIGGGLEEVAYDSETPNQKRNTHVILLTDGMVDIDQDPSVNQTEWRRIVDQVLPNYQKIGYKLHTIALSPNADRALMSKLALETGGSAAVAETSEELMANFLNIFDQAVPSEQLPLAGNEFLTDSSIEEFTALIFRDKGADETVLVSPANKEYRKSSVDPNLSWYHTPEYDLITIRRPIEGQWQVKAKLKSQSRITVVSDLSLVVAPMASSLSPSDDVQLLLRLEEDGKIVTRAEFLELLEITYELKNTSRDEEPWQGSLSDGLVPGNGIYSSRLGKLADIGQYELAIKVDGKTFKRQYIHRFSLRNPFEIALSPFSDEQGVYFSALVTSNTPGLDLKKTEVVGKLKDPSGSSLILPFTLNNSDQWVLKIRPEQKGKYQLDVRITTVDKSGDRSDVVPDAMTFTYPSTDVIAELETDPAEAEAEAISASVDSDFVTGEKDELTVEEKVPEEDDYTTLILYSVLGVVNVFIMVVAFFLYRMFKKRGSDNTEVGGEVSVDEVESSAEPSKEADMPDDSLPAMDSMEDDLIEPDFDEPPVEEPSVPEPPVAESPVAESPVAEPPVAEPPTDELTDDIDLSDPTSEQADIDSGPEKFNADDALLEQNSESLLEEDEEPEFSLDDFAPDSLDDNEFEEDPKP